MSAIGQCPQYDVTIVETPLCFGDPLPAGAADMNLPGTLTGTYSGSQG
jgi:hypothetical protein